MKTIYYIYSEAQGKVIEVNDTTAATTQELAIKRHFAVKRQMLNKQEQEALTALSKQIMDGLKDRD